MPCSLNSGAAFAQLIGRITDIQTKQPVSYVNYYNLRTEQGGLSDEAGNFRITQFFPSDTIEFSIIGYKTLRMKATDIRARPDVQLTENLQLLREVPVLAYDKRWHTLLLEARSNFSEDAYSSKSYYLLESFRDSQQVECSLP
ncbi:MAG: carboxypeptidase-like regulatory domain-containing protein [Saprospiraceae bacterium]|nr:carboxypeptidase-like regulatory domain-containing protein [Saprospiraceae bacterium]